MRTLDELTEEVYNDTSYRSEFTAYTKLYAILTLHNQQILSGVYASSEKTEGKFIGYYEMREAMVKRTLEQVEADTPQIKKCKQGIALLFTGLFRSMVQRYKLTTNDARTLVLAVATRYQSV